MYIRLVHCLELSEMKLSSAVYSYICFESSNIFSFVVGKKGRERKNLVLVSVFYFTSNFQNISCKAALPSYQSEAIQLMDSFPQVGVEPTNVDKR